ncbi:MAG TPA: hypothetical protein VJV23_08845 [Candidatus Polarisedimenticolia bacterium]|nr:hypothetical protein [Candidatus Polarisedimenticolia bacterium]
MRCFRAGLSLSLPLFCLNAASAEGPGCTELRLDKQVSCDGGITFVDVDLVEMNEDGTHGCVGWNAHPGHGPEPIILRYVASNVGGVGVTGCILHETNTALRDSVGLGSLPAGGEIVVVDDDQVCTEALDDLEPDTGAIVCFCPSEGNPFDFPVSATDSADFDCQTPGLMVHKVCRPSGPGESQVLITVANSGDAWLQDCTVTEEIFLDDPSCPADFGLATPVAPSLTAIASLPAGGAAVEIEASISGLQTDACNKVSVHCGIEGSDKTITAVADDVCEAGEGCLTRTPGFWGTHPHVAEGFLPVEVCGISLTHAEAGAAGSTTEDLCFGGRDFKAASTSPQQLQLIRQCTAAALNIAASASAGGSCESSFAGINNLVAECCTGPVAACSSGAAASALGASGCIERLDAFNHSPDTLAAFGPFGQPGPAQPAECREANGNGFVNAGRTLGPAEAAAGKSKAKKALKIRGHSGKRRR